ncbi:hypothetical protein [Gordonia sp. (in: high G+C Gram-positive bacteria)]|uniref:hypothetical protein n=1 Tax=Gordonia sp. (in: high G+C Gram-positive bacteria) TaxID=84139 RepID=UPI003C725602
MSSVETRNSGRGEIASVLAQYPAVGDREIDGHHYEVVTSYASPLPANDTNHAWVGRTLPGGLVEFWSQISSAVLLFSEGSDGLRILTPGESRTITDRISVEHEVGEEFFHENDFITNDWHLIDSLGDRFARQINDGSLMVLTPTEYFDLLRGQGIPTPPFAHLTFPEFIRILPQ